MPPVLRVSGPSISQELVYNNTLLGLASPDVGWTPTAWLNALLFDGWTIGTVDGGLSNVQARFDGVPIFNAIAKIADILGVHVRELSGRRIDMGAFGTASGIVLMAPGAIDPSVDNNPLIGIIESIKVTEEGTGIVNRIIPCGAGEGQTLFQLGPTTGAAAGSPWSTRVAPYAIHSAVGPNDETYYYLEDAASKNTYGMRIKVLSAKDIAPIANSPTAWENGANALYDLAAAYLAKFKDPLKVYDITVSKLSDTFEVGDTVRVIYRGIAVTDVATRTTWLNVNANLVVLEKTRSFDSSGTESWGLKVATVARYLQDDQEILIGALETLRAFKTAVKFYTFESNSGSERDSIQSGHNFDYTVEYDNNVSYLHKVMLYVQLKGQKAAGGAAGSAHTHELVHHHHLDDITAPASGLTMGVSPWDHTHTMFENEGNAPYGFADAHIYETTAGKRFVGGNIDSGEFRTGSTAYINNVSAYNHTHAIAAQTTKQNENTTTTANTDHTHGFVGIVEHAVPASPGVMVFITPPGGGTPVNVTALLIDTLTGLSLGGGYSGPAQEFVTDISAFMVDADGHPHRRRNIVSLRTTNATAFDLIVQVRSLLSASAIEAS